MYRPWLKMTEYFRRTLRFPSVPLIKKNFYKNENHIFIIKKKYWSRDLLDEPFLTKINCQWNLNSLWRDERNNRPKIEELFAVECRLKAAREKENKSLYW